MQSTIYVEMAPGVTVEDLYQQLSITYKVNLLFISGIKFVLLVKCATEQLLIKSGNRNIKVINTGHPTPNVCVCEILN